MTTHVNLNALRDQLDQARTDDPLTLMNIVAEVIDGIGTIEAATHTALIALQDRLAALEGAQTETERRLAQLERIARLAHAERRTYRAWQEDADAPWSAVKAASAALVGALAALGSGATLTFSYLEPESDQGPYQGAPWALTPLLDEDEDPNIK